MYTRFTALDVLRFTGSLLSFPLQEKRDVFSITKYHLKTGVQEVKKYLKITARKNRICIEVYTKLTSQGSNSS